MKEVVINSGISSQEIKNYFKEVASPLSSGKYLGKNWEVAVKILEDRGYVNLPIPHTLIIFKGEDDAVDNAVQRYRRAFLRGGG